MAEYCCELHCFVPPIVKVNHAPCYYCCNAGYCNCRCVTYRLERYDPHILLKHNKFFEIKEIECKLVDPPLFYTPQYAHSSKPFYFIHLVYDIIKVLENKIIPLKEAYSIIIPPEVTILGFYLLDVKEPTFELIREKAQIFSCYGPLDYRFYPNILAGIVHSVQLFEKIVTEDTYRSTARHKFLFRKAFPNIPMFEQCCAPRTFHETSMPFHITSMTFRLK